ncbi:glycoside hydrolase family 43 [Lecanosticta acicola]|uniref:Glycoside hydrolase family 43 n=1 Tax=Lecanosticta acicola TaxID=111012 RepID=A0AAI9EFH6_9PEZI|nr:glycoside hydrolase family 43 [Lecanosticta acicola]
MFRRTDDEDDDTFDPIFSGQERGFWAQDEWDEFPCRIIDPSIINVNDTWYSFSTNSGGRNIQIATSDDFDTWTLLQTDALPDLPAWISDQPTDVWAPDVSLLDNGYFIMYYTARTDEDSRYHCVGAATSQSIEGPFEPCSDDPLICDLSVGGAIDPAGYEEDGQRYILWKVDGNALPYGSGPCGPTNHTTPLYIQPVAADGVTLQGSKSQLVDNQGSSDDGIVEAPSLTKCGSTYVLFFSSGCFTTTNYKVNYATSTSLTGGFQRAQNALFQTGTQNLTAPGGASIDRDAKHLVFHANYNGGRALWTDIVTIDGDQVSA